MRVNLRLARLRPRLQSLSVRIFLWTWAAMTLAGVVLLELETSRTQRITDRWRSVTADAFALYALSAAKDHEDTQAWEAREFLADLERRTGIRAWMFDEKGREISGYARVAYRRLDAGRRARIRTLMAKTLESRVSEFTFLENVTLAAHTARAPSGRSYTLVGELPVLRYGPWHARPYIQVLRLIAVSLAAGIVSWVLSRRLISPIQRLRAASHEIARGNLAARAGMTFRGSGDELEELAHDFDAMAQRIEVLLQEKEQLVGAQRRLLRDVSHELRSPLTRLHMALELARDEQGEEATLEQKAARNNAPGDYAQTFERINREVQRLSEMVNHLLALSRLESGMPTVQTTPLDLATLIRSIYADAVFEGEKQGRTVILARCDTCKMEGHSELLYSAIENVVRNALLHTPEGKSITIELQNEGEERAIIVVRDQGEGVPPDQLEAIFQPFYRTTEARGRKTGGTGLGLAISRRAVESHGGTVTAHNSPEGGLVIEIRLPLA